MYIPEERNREPRNAFARSVLPAFFAPLLLTSALARLTSDATLARASYSVIAPTSALGAGLVTLGLRFVRAPFPSVRACVAAVTVLFALLYLGAWVLTAAFDDPTLREAPFSFALGGAITLAIGLRERTRVAAFALVVVGATLPGCAGAQVTSPRPPRTATLRAAAHEGEFDDVWTTYDAIAHTCALYADRAEEAARRAARQQRRRAVGSTVVGVLGTSAGIAGGLLASEAHGNGDDDAAFARSLGGGITAMGFGLAATAMGLRTSAAGRAYGDAMATAAALDDAVARHTVLSLTSTDLAERRAALVREGTSLARACAQHATQLEETATLAVPVESPPRVRQVARVLVRTQAEDMSDAALAHALFGEGGGR